MTDREKILKQALQQYWAAQTLLDKDGYIIGDRSGGKKCHPALTLQKHAFAQLKELLKSSDASTKVDLNEFIQGGKND